MRLDLLPGSERQWHWCRRTLLGIETRLLELQVERLPPPLGPVSTDSP